MHESSKIAPTQVSNKVLGFQKAGVSLAFVCANCGHSAGAPSLYNGIGAVPVLLMLLCKWRCGLVSWSNSGLAKMSDGAALHGDASPASNLQGANFSAHGARNVNAIVAFALFN